MFYRIRNKIVNYVKNQFQQTNTIHERAQIMDKKSISGSYLSKEVVVGDGVKVENSSLMGTISIGEGSLLDGARLTGTIVCAEECRFYECSLAGDIQIGRYSSIWGPNINIISRKEDTVSIGSFCSIARNVTMQTFNHNYKKASTYFIGKNFFKEKWSNEKVSKGGIIVGNDVWIGSHVVILGGINIGHGAVIAANSVVNSDIPPYAIAAGSPAKVINYRFDKVVITKLLEMKWWEWSNEQMHKNKSFFEHELNLEMLDEFAM